MYIELARLVYIFIEIEQIFINFHPLEYVDRSSDPHIQVGENINCIM